MMWKDSTKVGFAIRGKYVWARYCKTVIKKSYGDITKPKELGNYVSGWDNYPEIKLKVSP